MDPQGNEEKKSEKWKCLKKCIQKVQLSKAAPQRRKTKNSTHPPHATHATRSTRARHALDTFFCLWKPRFVKKIAFFCKPSLSISNAFFTSRTRTSSHWRLQQIFKLPHVDQDLREWLKQKKWGLPGSLLRLFSRFWRKSAEIIRLVLRVSNLLTRCITSNS